MGGRRARTGGHHTRQISTLPASSTIQEEQRVARGVGDKKGPPLNRPPNTACSKKASNTALPGRKHPDRADRSPAT